MNPKALQFLCFCWFVSTFICLILEGSYFGSSQSSVIQSLSVLTTFNIGNLLSVPVFNINFVQGIVRILLWDYSFYSGGWVIFRWFWTVVLDPGIVWGMITAFVWLYGQALSLFHLL